MLWLALTAIACGAPQLAPGERSIAAPESAPAPVSVPEPAEGRRDAGAPSSPAEGRRDAGAPSSPAEGRPDAGGPSPPPIPPNTAVLHIGDSFALAGFAQALRPRMKALRVRYEVKSEQSSFTVTWAAKMERVVADNQPDLVIINLGANEVANINPPSHAHAVRRIVKSIGGRPCVWVSPPLWRKDTGIIDVIRENSAPCRFFDSDTHVSGPIPRQGDRIHPNEEGGAMWADAFWRWLEAERAPAEGGRRSPWTLKPAPPEEHLPR
jgi:hypothetical protein